MWVKICANTSAADALAAAAAGADAVGFVFAPSPRQVTADQVRLITDRLPARIERVGVFLPTSPDQIAAVVDQARLDAVQLHGGIDSRFAGLLMEQLSPGTELIQTIAWQIGADGAEDLVAAELQEAAHEGLSRRVLIDAKVGRQSGGLGVAFDWQLAQSVFASQPGLDLIVAGGLRPDNVAEAIQTLRPWGVDVASGVEAEPGRKDHTRVHSFIVRART